MRLFYEPLTVSDDAMDNLHTAATAKLSPTILMIDDSVFEQRLVADLFEDRSWTLDVAADGEVGYQLAKCGRPDMILLDVRMPKLDGFACCRLLKADPATRDIPVIFLSGADAVEEKLQGFEAGGVDFVAKPFHASELMARVEIHLQLARRAAGTIPADAEPSEEPCNDEDAVLVGAAQRVIDANLAQVPGLSELARRVGTYRERLSAAFRCQKGQTVFAYVRERRLERSRQLLRETRMEIRDIADLVGFTSAANFATAFREWAGASPSAYRRTLQ